MDNFERTVRELKTYKEENESIIQKWYRLVFLRKVDQNEIKELKEEIGRLNDIINKIDEVCMDLPSEEYSIINEIICSNMGEDNEK